MQVVNRNALTLAVVAAALALASCGGDVIPGVPAARTATPTQYASALNGAITSWQKEWEDFSNEGCPIEDNGSPVCKLGPSTMWTKASTIAGTIQLIELIDSPYYIGAPPFEISKLTNDTYTAAQIVAADLSGPDHEPIDGWLADVASLNKTLDGWAPYQHP